ncbi:lantibiotic dehydratase [Kitasatospora acidiphila]|uniref:Lantibiotic dehydratase n=1 Tax=Kitasatospora acidiphila TaxID=2567942 RepID=A0A540W161_9ACTN|nr:lantibiotic dehydratase [Kitasatospora acidiphila]TQF02697.1 lantibiotic dehydratase [Kitasatospora acidiphila]
MAERSRRRGKRQEPGPGQRSGPERALSEGGVRFDAVPGGLLRVAMLPRPSAGAGEVDLRDPDQVADYLDELTADPRVLEAIAVANMPLYTSVAAIRARAAVRPRTLAKTALATTRYVLRGASRPTPLGLLAGVAPVAFADSCRVRLGAAHRGVPRPGGEWLAEEVAQWERRPGVLRKLRVVRNDLGFRRGDRWVLPCAPGAETSSVPGRGMEEVSAKYTTALELVLRAAERPTPAGVLTDRLTSAFPRVPVTRIEDVLVDLVRRGFLLTELHPPLTSMDPLQHILDVLRTVDEKEAAAELADIAERLHRHGQYRPGTGLESWRSLVDAMGARHPHRRPLGVDLLVDADVVLPEAVLREAERAATALWRLRPRSGAAAHLVEYHAAFLERYGTDQAVPLLDLLDPHVGLGTPAGYDNPRSERSAPVAGPTADDAEREAWLLQLVSTAAVSGVTEVVIDDEMITALDDARLDDRQDPGEICLHLTADSPQALTEGDFVAVLSSATGSPLPGSLAGRFAHLLDDPRSLGDLVRRGTQCSSAEGALPVEVDFQPTSQGVANAARVPSFFADRLAIGCFGDPGATLTRRAPDIAVAADAVRLYFVEAATGREITPVFPHAGNARLAPAAVRFLWEVPRMATSAWVVWQWGVLAAAPYLPRVRYGRTVLTPARWRPDSALSDATVPDAAWELLLDRWRARWQVPDRVDVGTGDRRVALDLTRPLHRRLLRRDLARGVDLLVSETPADAGGRGHGWLRDESGTAHASELIVPLLPHHPRTLAPAPRPQVTTTPTRRHPEWLSAKLYGATARQHEVLTEHLPLLLAGLPDGVDRWFFVRYRDPDPHLRLRFHGSPDVLHGPMARAVLAWADRLREQRLAGRLVFDGYEPETARYGGPDVITAVERHFHHDSLRVLHQLRSFPDGVPAGEKALLAAVDFADTVRGVHGSRWPGWFLDAALDEVCEPHRDYAHRHRQETWARYQRSDPTRTESAGWSEALAALSSQRRSVLLSVLHMHHNRLVGPDRQTEGRALALARCLAEAEEGRRRYAHA